jgi:hypothetical protein
MPKTQSIEYVVDEKGRRKRVILSYKAFTELMEDLADLRMIEARKGEPVFDLDAVVQELKDAGRL